MPPCIVNRSLSSLNRRLIGFPCHHGFADVVLGKVCNVRDPEHAGLVFAGLHAAWRCVIWCEPALQGRVGRRSTSPMSDLRENVSNGMFLLFLRRLE